MSTQKEKFKIRLGLFVIGGLVLFGLAIFIIGKQRNLFDPVFRLATTFYNVSGLQVGNNVRFSGINVGTVSRILMMNDSTVHVDMLIKESVRSHIKTDSEVAIGSEGIIGDRLLLISQGSAFAPEVQSGDELVSSEPVETDAIITSLEVTALNVEIITDQLAAIMRNINSGKGTLGRLIQDSTIADNLSRTMRNLEAGSKGLEQNMEAASENVLLRGYFKRQARDERKKKEAAEKAAKKAAEAKEK